MKLNELLNKNIKAYGFKALQDFAQLSNPNGDHVVVVSSLSPAIMLNMGIDTYYAPVLPYGAVYNNAEDIKNADLNANVVHVQKVQRIDVDNVIIVSNHQGTIDIARKTYPYARVYTGNVTPNDIRDKVVVGTLPPHLVACCDAYVAYIIKGYDWSTDKSLAGQALQDRLIINDPIKVTICGC